jgi:hypothetical protein
VCLQEGVGERIGSVLDLVFFLATGVTFH